MLSKELILEGRKTNTYKYKVWPTSSEDLILVGLGDYIKEKRSGPGEGWSVELASRTVRTSLPRL